MPTTIHTASTPGFKKLTTSLLIRMHCQMIWSHFTNLLATLSKSLLQIKTTTVSLTYHSKDYTQDFKTFSILSHVLSNNNMKSFHDIYSFTNLVKVFVVIAAILKIIHRISKTFQSRVLSNNNMKSFHKSCQSLCCKCF